MKRFRETGVFLALAILCIVWAVSLPMFLRPENLYNIGLAFTFIGIMAVGEAFVMLSGGIDLSVGAIMGLAGVVTAGALSGGTPLPLALAYGLMTGLVLGAVNGGLIVWGRIPPFIATLGMLSVARSLAFERTQGNLFSNFPPAFLWLGQGDVVEWEAFRLPFPLLVLVVLTLAAMVALSRTTFGRHLYAVGGNEASARLSGVKVGGVKLGAYMISGLLAAVAGILQAAYIGVAQGQDGQGYELDVIAAVVIGGVSLAGGEGTAFGAVLGAALMGVLRNGLILRGEPAFRQILLIGVVIWLAAGVDVLRRRGWRRSSSSSG
ncbi:MAG: ABC transporter permease [Armatimonadetes bacterium]|nr:ABC transporter permease [Armatimonadota bacterium]